MRGKKRLFYSWFFSYLLILMIPLLITGFIYSKTGKTVETEIGKANTALVTQLQAELDGRIAGIKRVFNQLALNPRIQSLAMLKDTFRPQDMNNLYKLVNEFNQYTLIDSYFSDLFVCLNRPQTVVNRNGHNSAKLFYEVFIDSTDFSLDEFLHISTEANNGTVVFYTRRSGEKMIAFVHPITFLGMAEKAMTAFVTLQEEAVENTLKAMNWHAENTIMIVDKDNRIISAIGNNIPSKQLSYDEFSHGSGMIDGQPNTFTVRDSQVQPWRYVVITPTYVFYEGARQLQLYAMIGLFVCMVVCISLAYYFAKRNFNPIRELVQALTRTDEGENAENRNQLKWILKTVEELIHAKQSASLKLYQQTLLLKQNIISKLVKDWYDSRTIAKEMTEAEVALQAPFYTVVLFETETIVKTLREAESNEHLNLSAFVLVNFFENLMPSSYSIESAELDGHAVCIVGLPYSDNSHIEVMVNTAYEALNQAGIHYKIEAHVGVGGICTGLEQLHSSYREALEALEYREKSGEDEVVAYSTIRNRQKKYYYPLDEEQRILNAIKAGDAKMATMCMTEVVEKNLGLHGISIDMRRLLIFDISSTIVKALEDDVSESSLLESLSKLSDLNESALRAALLSAVQEACELNMRKWEADSSRSDALLKDVMVYVEKHYSDPNLSISVIGAAFNLTPGYISKQFKELTGEGLLNHVNNVRMKHAKELLQKDTSVNDVCTQVGYTNIGTLIRVFKKTYGVTPGQIKKISE